MTEKRWALTFDDKIVDNKYNITHDVHSGYDVAFSFMNILNDYEEEYNGLKDQNEQLKKELESFKPIIFESDGKPVTLYKKGDVE